MKAAELHDAAPQGSESTRDRIMEATKILVARKGVRATTVRDICHATGVNIAAVNYYFRSKSDLTRQALLGILEPVNRHRETLLCAAIEEYGAAPVPVERIIACLAQPMIDDIDEKTGSSLFLRALQHMRAELATEVNQFVHNSFDSVAQLFVNQLARSLPELSRSEVAWRYELLRGSVIHILADCDPLVGKLRFLGVGPGSAIQSPEDRAYALQAIIAYSIGGLTAPPAWPSSSEFIVLKVAPNP